MFRLPSCLPSGHAGRGWRWRAAGQRLWTVQEIVSSACMHTHGHAGPHQARQIYLVVADWRAIRLSMNIRCTQVHIEKETHTECTKYWGKHHPTTKTHNCSLVEDPSIFIDFFSTATRSSFGSCFIREFFMRLWCGSAFWRVGELCLCTV